MKRNFVTGFISGAVACTMIGAVAANVITMPNEYPVKFNGEAVSMEGYNIDDYSYFKLRDIAKVVGGFDVDFQDNTVLLSSQSNTLAIKEEGMFSSGGTVTEPQAGEFDETTNWLDNTRAGNTAHVDHANVLYQLPANETGLPMVFLHGYGQSRMGWMTTPDGREGWSTSFLKKGHGVFLVDQPRRGEAGATTMDEVMKDVKEKTGKKSIYVTHSQGGRVGWDVDTEWKMKQ